MRVDPSLFLQLPTQETNVARTQVDFGKMMEEYLGDVNELQLNADAQTQALIVGETDNVHDVMIATEEAQLALELTVQIRNKVIEAYQELIKMQI